jgi:predicted alpha/beta hydrolase family esterase
MKQQILVIHGGDTWKSRDEYLHFLSTVAISFEKMTRLGWKENLRTDLGDAFEVVLPAMPNKWDARFEEWKMVFEKLLPHLRDDLILIGHSMGGAFIVKYLAENAFPRRVKATYLVAAPYRDNPPEYELLSFSPPKNLIRFNAQAGLITIYQGEDDPVVPRADAEKYKKLLPESDLQFLAYRGHFGQEHFPELTRSILDL